MANIALRYVFMLTSLTLVVHSQFITEPGDEVLYGVVGHPLLVPCVLEQDYTFKIWNIAGEFHTSITIASRHRSTLFPEYTEDYRLIQSGTNFSLLILSLQLDQPPLYCAVTNLVNYKSSISRIRISGSLLSLSSSNLVQKSGRKSLNAVCRFVEDLWAAKNYSRP